jgi:hypothetical protein
MRFNLPVDLGKLPADFRLSLGVARFDHRPSTLPNARIDRGRPSGLCGEELGGQLGF